LLILLVSALCASVPSARATAQQAEHGLSVERIFGSRDLLPEGLPITRWTPDGTAFTFVATNPDKGTDLYSVDARTGARTLVIDGSTLIPGGERQPIAIEGYQWSPDGSMLLLYTRSVRVWRQKTKGVYFVYHLEDGTLQPVSTRFGYQQFAKFSPDGSRVGFVRDHDLWMVDLATGKETRLTTDGSDRIINGTFDWVYEEELGLRDGWRWSPDGRRIAFWQLDQTPIKTFYLIDDIPLYPKTIPIPYPKAGEPNSFARIGVLDVSSKRIRWIDTGDNPDVYLARMEWAESSDELVIQRMNRHQNRIDVMLADATSGAARVLFSETSDTWVDVDLDMTWLDEGRRFLWSSERDGFKHLYLYRRDGTLERQLTKGPWDVQAPAGVDAQGWVYFTAAKDGPLERHLYRVPWKGGTIERLTRSAGTHRIDMAPGARFYIDRHSRAGDPPVITLNGRSGETLRTFLDNRKLRQELARMRLRTPEFFTFTTAEGVELNGWMIKPPDFDPQRSYPVLIYVYGGPGSQTVTDAWGGTRYLWHQMLARQGFIIASVDNRGTGARGRDFKNVTYLKLGVYESRDQVEAARYLASLPYVDPAHIGIWGWSYGGFMTLATLMSGGDLFAAGIAVAPVTNWRFYDTIYTERYMRTPRENPEGYAEGSPLEHVDGLKADLLLVHGTGDDNVHFQNSVQLIQRLEQADKQFRLMIYPNKTHAIAGRETRIHLYTLMTDFLKEKLDPPAP